MTKPTKQCSNCMHWSRHVCLDQNNKPVPKQSYNPDNKYVHGTEEYWYYEECKKNWGLPQFAYTSADSCKYYKLVVKT